MGGVLNDIKNNGICRMLIALFGLVLSYNLQPADALTISSSSTRRVDIIPSSSSGIDRRQVLQSVSNLGLPLVIAYPSNNIAQAADPPSCCSRGKIFQWRTVE